MTVGARQSQGQCNPASVDAARLHQTEQLLRSLFTHCSHNLPQGSLSSVKMQASTTVWMWFQEDANEQTLPDLLPCWQATFVWSTQTMFSILWTTTIIQSTSSVTTTELQNCWIICRDFHQQTLFSPSDFNLISRWAGKLPGQANITHSHQLAV